MQKLTVKQMKKVQGGAWIVWCYYSCASMRDTDPDKVFDCMDICDMLDEPV